MVPHLRQLGVQRRKVQFSGWLPMCKNFLLTGSEREVEE